MSNLTPNMNQISIEINGNLNFFSNWGWCNFLKLYTISNMKINIFQIKIFNEITLLVFVIYSFIKFKVLVSLPKGFNGLLSCGNVLQLVN